MEIRESAGADSESGLNLASKIKSLVKNVLGEPELESSNEGISSDEGSSDEGVKDSGFDENFVDFNSHTPGQALGELPFPLTHHTSNKHIGFAVFASRILHCILYDHNDAGGTKELSAPRGLSLKKLRARLIIVD
jgi:hypothetical protein